MGIPITISTQEFYIDTKQKILVPKEEFVKLIIQNKNDIVFCCGQKNSLVNTFYIVLEGYCFYTDSYLIENYKEFTKVIDFLNFGYESFKDYAEALTFGITEREEYEKFKQSGFLNIHNLKSYQEFKDFQKGGFLNKVEYFKAQKLEISTKIDYDEFLNSGFNRYNEFIDAKIHGFLNKDDFHTARASGFDNNDEYQEFLKSGCTTKEDFDFFKKKLPSLIRNSEKTLTQSLKDANIAIESGRFEEFIRLNFLALEKLTEAFYLKIFKKDLKSENDKIIDDMIEDIGNKIEIRLVDINELKYWRRIRNKVIHENLKIDKDKAEKGKEFFDEFYKKMYNAYTKYTK
jgi:hypothetical protein